MKLRSSYEPTSDSRELVFNSGCKSLRICYANHESIRGSPAFSHSPRIFCQATIDWQVQSDSMFALNQVCYFLQLISHDDICAAVV